MKPDNGKDSLFFTGKPKNIPKQYIPPVIGIITAMV